MTKFIIVLAIAAVVGYTSATAVADGWGDSGSKFGSQSGQGGFEQPGQGGFGQPGDKPGCGKGGQLGVLGQHGQQGGLVQPNQPGDLGFGGKKW